MALPKVKFIKREIEDNLDDLVWYAKPEHSDGTPPDHYKNMMIMFPNLKGKIVKNMSDEEVYMILDKEIRPYLENLFKNSSDSSNYQEAWDKIYEAVMYDLEDILNIKWSGEDITCRVGLLPVCPRYIKERIFDLNYGNTSSKMISIAIHEICHFLYFEKWKEIFPNHNEEEFNNPHIAWYLSEAMIDPLINNEMFKKYTDDDLSAYPVFYETIINGKSVIEILREYVANYPIDEAIKHGYELFKTYENEIKNPTKNESVKR